MQSGSLAARCRGRWPEIWRRLVPYEELFKAIDRLPRKTHGWCPSPLHNDQRHGDAFRAFPDVVMYGGVVCNTCGVFPTGFETTMWLLNTDEKTTGRELRRVLDEMDSRVGAPPPMIVSAPREKSSERDEWQGPTREALLELRNQAKPLTHKDAEPARRYLTSRGFAALDLSTFQPLRCHRGLPYYDEDRQFVGCFPTLIADIEVPAGEVVSIQRYFLTADGQKAPVKSVKKLLTMAGANASGGSLRLHPPGPVLMTCEGFENGLPGLLRNPHLPLWPALTAALLGSLVVPPVVRHIVVWADPDKAGRNAVNKLTARMAAEARTVEALYPRDTQLDWNDVFLRFGVEAIPKLSSSVRMLPTAYRLAQLRHGVVVRG